MNYKDLRSLSLKRYNIPKEHSVRKTLRKFTIAEKTIFFFFSIVFVFSGLTLAWDVNSAFLQEVPTQGGTLTEGVVGNPRFINPVLAISEADKNLSSLIFSGLVRITPEGGVENDLASEVTVSEDRRTYTVHIDPNARFHDDTKVTADDVLFTIQKITDPTIKSPKRGNWEGVTLEKIDDETLTFTLKQAYTPFIYNLSVGILPRNIWKNVSTDEFSFSQFNTLPIGSGPYKVDRVERNSGGIPDFYKLTVSENLSQGQPFIKNLVFKFYPSESNLIEAYNDHSVESISGISPERLLELDLDGAEVLSSPLPRVFAIFFNQNKAKVLLNKEVRKALDLASPKEGIVQDVLGGYGTVIDGPVPAGVYPWASERKSSTFYDERLVEAKKLLSDNGWVMNEETGVLEKKTGSATMTLSFSISTGDAPELKAVANELVRAWGELGAKVEILVSETGDLNQNVIRPRNFDSLLFGEVVGRDADLYPFWHSSQRQDPGLNIALYANNRADKFLDDARSASDTGTVESNYKSFVGEIEQDLPAIFLYTPSFLYVVPEKLESASLGSLTVSQDRFLGVRDWYIETDRVWNIFIN